MQRVTGNFSSSLAAFNPISHRIACLAVPLSMLKMRAVRAHGATTTQETSNMGLLLWRMVLSVQTAASRNSQTMKQGGRLRKSSYLKTQNMLV